ncbi:MAG TPA: protein kinase, partial [Methylomirabilota bacterium]|nr:protein kinase [Methylomirabilota bacterium]
EMASPELARRFRDEIRFARRVSHRNVCRIHEYGESGSLRYISMAFVDGIDLKHVLAATGPLPPAEALLTGRAVAAGLQAIHDEGIVHRDLKTANIMRDRKGVVRLMDFGIAKDWGAGAADQTATGVIVGTPEYMSPEQALGTQVDFRSDVYALGVVLFEIFTGRVPFQGETPIATLRKQVNDPPPLDGAEAAGLPRPMIAVLARALAKEPDARYASAAELREALEWARAASPGEQTVRIPARVAGATAPALTPVPYTRPQGAQATPVPGRVTTAVGSAVPTEAMPALRRRRAAWWGLGLGGAAALAAGVAAVATRPDTQVRPSPRLAPSAPPTTLAALPPATVPPAPEPTRTPVTLAASARPTPRPEAAT